MDSDRESEEVYSEERTDSDEDEHPDVFIEPDFNLNNQIQFYQPGQLCKTNMLDIYNNSFYNRSGSH